MIWGSKPLLPGQQQVQQGYGVSPAGDGDEKTAFG
jgi:hypothetical protein